MSDITADEYRIAEKVARSLGFATAQSYADHAARLESAGMTLDARLERILRQVASPSFTDRADYWGTLATAALEFLTSTGRLIPAGGHVLTAEEWANRITLADKQVAVSEAWEQGFEYGSGHKYGAEDDETITAEQVEDVRTMLWSPGVTALDAFRRLRALFPATEPAEDATEEEVTERELTERLVEKWTSAMNSARTSEHHFPADCLAEAIDMLLGQPTSAEPAEEETKAERGPEWFREIADAVDEIEKIPGMYHSMTLRSWAGVFRNHADTLELASSPVVPARTETGPWKTCGHVPIGIVFRSKDRHPAFTWVNEGGSLLSVRNECEDGHFSDGEHCLPSMVNENFAPFVAAEEG